MAYRIKTSHKAGRLVEWGNYAVPRRVSSTLEGEDGLPGTAGPDYSADFEVRDGNAECVKFTVTAKSEGRGIRSSDLSLFSVESLTQTAFLRVAYQVIEPGRAYAFAGDLETVPDAKRTIGQRVGREPGALLREVARIYLEDESGAGIIAVAVVLGVSRSTAARRIEAARKRGFIPPVDASKDERAAALALVLAPAEPEPGQRTMPLGELQKWARKRRNGEEAE
jgi:hypothetical protein